LLELPRLGIGEGVSDGVNEGVNDDVIPSGSEGVNDLLKIPVTPIHTRHPLVVICLL